jgi:hypothetical protein
VRAREGLDTAGSGFCGPGLPWPGGQAWGLACGLSPKTRPTWAWAFGLCSKSLSPHCGLGPGPAPALLFCFVDAFDVSQDGTIFKRVLDKLYHASNFS